LLKIADGMAVVTSIDTIKTGVDEDDVLFFRRRVEKIEKFRRHGTDSMTAAS